MAALPAPNSRSPKLLAAPSMQREGSVTLLTLLALLGWFCIRTKKPKQRLAVWA